MREKDYKTDRHCFSLLLLISGSLALYSYLSVSLSLYLSLSLSLSLLTDSQLCVLELRDLLLQENKHFIIIIWTQSVSYSVRCLLERNCHNTINEMQLPDASSTHAAPHKDTATTMFHCRHHAFFFCTSPLRRHTVLEPSVPKTFILVSSHQSIESE